ncbi:TMEM175 family protein [Agrococcus jejuensis]|uniref:TMEM175 family protein n=1 Tax=Agrococcus jejuensis TaxID=399736 RepID=UPI00119D0435|nr:TMEM175 family protein [Agrococcus jejuensis]
MQQPAMPVDDARPSAERMVFFTDAVVAIAMTLLILPLMESVSEGGERSAAGWAAEHADQLLAFLISFALVGTFWRWHHALYERVERYTPALMRLNFLWMLAIVWLPVATALSTADGGDASNVIVYVASIAAIPFVSAIIHLHVLRHPALVREGMTIDHRGLAANVSLVLVLGVALAIALLLPDVGYLALLITFATRFVSMALHRPIERLAAGPARARGAADGAAPDAG